MADNIKIIGNITNTTTVNRYSQDDIKLISSRDLQGNFGGKGDYIEFYIYDNNGNILNTDLNYLNYKLPYSSGLKPGINTLPNTFNKNNINDSDVISIISEQTGSLFPIIEIDPVKNLQDLGYSTGEFGLKYNFFHNIISNKDEGSLFVKEISSDRTEIKLSSTTLSNEEIENIVYSIIDKVNNTNYHIDYLLNFGGDKQYLTVNIALNKSQSNEILFKLYSPLPTEVEEKDLLWVVEEKVNPYLFNINLDKLILPNAPLKLRGPNFDIPIENQGTISTSYSNYNTLINTFQAVQSASYNQISNLLNSQSIKINVDYSDFSNFSFFGSVTQRLRNFFSKLKQIEDYSNFIRIYTPFVATTSSLQTTINQYSSSINTIISQFDGYENYLYFESGSVWPSTTWPKISSSKPYINVPTNSFLIIDFPTLSSIVTWYNELTSSAELYDSNNYNNLEYAVPSFIKDDSINQPFLLFLNMVGHYFDNIWIYLKSITDINLANNNLNKGISKDLVYERLRSLGVKLYNSKAGENLNQYLIGANTGSGLFNNTNFTITSSYLNNIPREDLVAELYKRIYHNLPLLVKQKGTLSGLENLITIFGITGSILNIKEYGGNIKSGSIREYNTEKVRIIDNTLTGSVLSSELSLQTYTTESKLFRDKDLNYIDISFSPETQMNTYISRSIASNNPTWSLDDYIGDPRQIYSSSYYDLDVQRKLYFETGVSGFPAFTSSLLDYNGFIRLIQYFDNSLFKMLNDFIPERTSLSTGVTINSPVLERNKVVYPIPNYSTQSIYDATYSSCSVSSPYGFLYEGLQGDKSPFFTGELSGSGINIYSYFEENNLNPYLGDWDVYNSKHSISESININKFLHSNFNVLLNNVSHSVLSNLRKGIEYFYGTTHSILIPVELQDSYLSLVSYNKSRYEGSQVSSLYYNTYTSASSNYLGDNSYGKTAAIDRNSYKIAWIKNIPSQSKNFYDKTSINLKYLVNKENSLDELSLSNFNLFEIQNIFKSGTPVILSLSDVQKPSNQVNLDGTKIIFKGGYSYDPILFRENNETLYFRHDNYISSSIGYLGVRAMCDDNYEYYSEEYTYGLHAPPINPADNSGNNGVNGSYIYKINGVDGSTTSGLRMSYFYYDANTWMYNSNPACNLTSYGVNVRERDRFIYSFNLMNFKNTGSQGGYNNETDPLTYSPLNGGNYFYKVPRTSTYKLNGKIPFVFRGDDSTVNSHGHQFGQAEFKVMGIVEKSTTPNDENSWHGTSPIAITTLQAASSPNASWDSIHNSIWYDDYMNDHSIFYCNLNTTVNLTAGEYVRFQFYIIDITNLFGYGGNLGEGARTFNFYINGAPPNKTVDKGYFEIYDTATPITLYYYTSSYGQTPPLFISGSSNTIVFSSSSQYLFVTSSSFIPQSSTQNYYTPVVDNFSIKKYDLWRIGSFDSPISTYYEVISVSSSLNDTYVTFNKPIDTSSFNNAVSFAILRPKPNETSVIIDYKKQPGEVSQTILIPNDINDTMKNSVGNIFKNLNSSL